MSKTAIQSNVPIKRESKGRRCVNYSEWMKEAEQLFGPDSSKWRFVCPGCKHVASVGDYKAAGAPEGAVGFDCIGRYLPTCRDWMGGDGSGPCNYAGGGLFGIHPVEVDFNGTKQPVFEFDRLPGEQQVQTDAT